MNANEWNDEQWAVCVRKALASNRFIKLIGIQLEFISGPEACVYVDWRDELGQMPENPIYNGGVPLTLVDQAACVAALPKFGNLNVVTRRESYEFDKPAPAGFRLYAHAHQLSFKTNPMKKGDWTLKAAEAKVDVFVKDYQGHERYLVGTGQVQVIWKGGAALTL